MRWRRWGREIWRKGERNRAIQRDAEKYRERVNNRSSERRQEKERVTHKKHIYFESVCVGGGGGGREVY